MVHELMRELFPLLQLPSLLDGRHDGLGQVVVAHGRGLPRLRRLAAHAHEDWAARVRGVALHLGPPGQRAQAPGVQRKVGYLVAQQGEPFALGAVLPRRGAQQAVVGEAASAATERARGETEALRGRARAQGRGRTGSGETLRGLGGEGRAVSVSVGMLEAERAGVEREGVQGQRAGRKSQVGIRGEVWWARTGLRHGLHCLKEQEKTKTKKKEDGEKENVKHEKSKISRG